MATSDRPFVSVVLTTRDRPRLLARALLSALAQENVDTEVVVVDDGSREPVADLLADDARSRVRVIRHPFPLGPAAARNAGLHVVHGQWVAFLDDDDFWAPQKLCTQLQLIAEHGADFAFVSGIVLNPDGEILDCDDAPKGVNHLHRMLLASDSIPCGSSNLLASTRTVRAIGGYDTGIVAMEDWDFNIRLSAVAKGVAGHDRLVGYTIHPNNRSQQQARLLRGLKQFDRKHGAARESAGVRFDLDEWFYWRVWIHQLAGHQWRGLRHRWHGAVAHWRLALIRRRPRMAIRGLAFLLGGSRLLNALTTLRSDPRPVLNSDQPQWVFRATHPENHDLRRVIRPGQLAKLTSCVQPRPSGVEVPSLRPERHESAR